MECYEYCHNVQNEDSLPSELGRKNWKSFIQSQGLVTIHVNILSMHKHVQGRTPFLPPLASSRVCFLNMLFES
jgi:hypothetical protein